MSKTFSAEEVSQHNTRDDIWIIYNNKVYDVTQYLDEHPGGEEVILDCAGGDSTEAFDDIGHSEDAHEMLESLFIGDLIGGIKPKSNNSKSSGSGSGDSNLPLIGIAVVILAIIAYFFLNK
ncbi:Cytochrome b5 [Pichia californica]|uniref:Cytochrome b5 n=1 Tax=Pichia californica TaxID=460514 RepID=A0A9P6WKY4_9ASCO|nr:Cytochrome b5 [[Candida] californica]KAG0687997.1 Cytochrome b5 [[Candida] californica]